ncbi:MAG TPA: hypothetical protein DCY88_30220 [Cyanobacteria bacterium UBA11372]|nr:hypothetical protein [Cyanobacteria bacterium UBA11372]
MDITSPPVSSKAKAALVELQKLFSSIDTRLQQFPSGSLEPKLEIEALIEIGQLTEQLPVYEQVLKDVGYLGS